MKMLKNYKKYFLYISTVSFALPAFAQSNNCPSSPSTLHDLLTCFIAYKIQHYIPFLLVLATLVFLYGVLRFVGSGDNEEARQSGRNVMIFGVIVLFVMFSVWGIVGLIYSSFFSGAVTLPNSLPVTQRAN